MAKRSPRKTSKKVAKKRRSKKSARKQSAQKLFFAAVEYNGDRYEGQGKTSVEAFESIQYPFPLGIFKTTIRARLAHNNMQSDIVFFAVQFRRFVSMKMSREIFCKRLEMRLKPVNKIIHAE